MTQPETQAMQSVICRKHSPTLSLWNIHLSPFLHTSGNAVRAQCLCGELRVDLIPQTEKENLNDVMSNAALKDRGVSFLFFFILTVELPQILVHMERAFGDKVHYYCLIIISSGRCLEMILCHNTLPVSVMFSWYGQRDHGASRTLSDF